MNATLSNAADRFVATLAVGAKQAAHLEWSRKRLFQDKIDARWVAALAERPELAERLEAFVSRYGRLQDTLADKLLPRWLLALADGATLVFGLRQPEQLEDGDASGQRLGNTSHQVELLRCAAVALAPPVAPAEPAPTSEHYHRARPLNACLPARSGSCPPVAP